MKENVDEFSMTFLVDTHKGGDGEIDNENAEANGDQKKGLEFLLDGQIDKGKSDKPHDHMSPVKVDNSGLEDYSMER